MDVCARQTALERQDLSCTHLAHHELESAAVIVIIITRDGSVASTLYLPIHLCTAVSH